MKKIYICTRYKSVSREGKNKRLAQIYSRLAWDQGFFPIFPQLYLPQFLDDWSKTEREAAERLSMKAIEYCDEVWVFGKTIAKNVKDVIERAAELKIPVKYFTELGEEEAL